MQLIKGTEEQAGIINGTAKKIENRIKEWLDTGYTPMTQYFAAHNGIVFLDGAQGKKSPDLNNELLTVDSVFPVSSITKTFTAALVMMLAEDGVLAPTDFVYRHIPEFDGGGKNRVSIAHLLTHTSGIDSENIWKLSQEELDRIEVPADGNDYSPNLRKYIYACCHMDNKCAPGVEMSYSSLGLNIVGEIIQRVTGKKLSLLMREKIFDPLNMKSTFLGVPEHEYERVVNYPENAYFNIGIKNRKNISASGGAYSNARDLSVFGQMLLNKGEYNGVRILSRLSVEAMTRNQIQGISAIHDGVRFREAGWGFSLMLSLDKYDETGTLRSPDSYGHSGAGCSMFLVDPVNNIVASLLYCTLKNPKDDHFERRFDRFYNMVLSGVI